MRWTAALMIWTMLLPGPAVWAAPNDPPPEEPAAAVDGAATNPTQAYVPPPTFSQACWQAAVDELHGWRKYPFLKTIINVLKLPFLPIYLLGKFSLVPAASLLWGEIRGKERKPLSMIRLFRSDLLITMLFAGLVAVGASPSEFYNRVIVGTSHPDLVKPSDLDPTKGPVFAMNAMSPGDPTYKPVSYLCGKPNAKDERMLYVEGSDFKDGLVQLVEHHKKYGPHKAFALGAHSFPGTIFMGQAGPEENLDDAWIERNRAFLESLPKDLFAPDAQAYLISSEPAIAFQMPWIQTPDGEAFVRKLFGFLFKQGGQVHTSTRIVYFDYSKIPSDYQPPGRHNEEARTAYGQLRQQFIEGGIAVYGTLRLAGNDTDSILHRIKVVRIDPRP